MSECQCPRHERCSAPICPADPQWRERTMLNGERVCLLFVEASKHGGRLPQTPTLSVELVRAVQSAYPEAVARYGPLRRRLRETASTPSRLGRRVPAGAFNDGL